ncbi:MAG: zinc ABC transporter substrate-binding protein [Tepidiphilus sp.]|nr:zinc ABC transporter substrate-binding protein [Tepidiphilus sp.]
MFTTTRRRILLALAAAPLLGLHAPKVQASSPLPVVATFSIAADWIRQVGGDRVQVTSLIGPDADAHGYQPKPSDTRVIKEAALVVGIDLGFDDWVERLARSAGKKNDLLLLGKNLLNEKILLSAGPSHDDHDDHAHGEFDPHFWQDPRLVAQAMPPLAEALAQRDPTHADHYRQRATEYAHSLESLWRQWSERFAALPPDARRAYTNHDAFRYLARAYGLELIGIQGVVPHGELSAKALAALADRARREGIRVAFLENVADPRLVEQLRRESGLTVGGRLYSDALSGPTGPAPTYLDLVEVNARTLHEALAASTAR